jgi:hypothetical protein
LTKGSKVTVAGSLAAGLYEGKLDLKVNVADVALQGGKQDAAPARQRPAPVADDLDDDCPF